MSKVLSLSLMIIFFLVAVCKTDDDNCGSVDDTNVMVCLHGFFIHHEDAIKLIVNTSKCDLQNLDCSVYTNTVNCLNDLKLDADCRENLKDEINDLTGTLNITCTVSVMESLCPESPKVTVITDNGTGTTLSPGCLSVMLVCLMCVLQRRW